MQIGLSGGKPCTMQYFRIIMTTPEHGLDGTTSTPAAAAASAHLLRCLHRANRVHKGDCIEQQVTMYPDPDR